VQAMPIKVTGVDALHEPFTEQTNTVMISCHGCKYQSKHYVPRGAGVTIEIPRRGLSSPPRITTGKVIWVQRPRNAREVLHIGLEFDEPGNVWDIPSPPADWFRRASEPEIEIEVEEPPAVVGAGAVVGTTASWDASEIPTMSNPAERHLAELEITREEAERSAAAAIAREIAGTGPVVDAHIRETIAEAVDNAVAAAVDGLAESIADEVRRAHEENLQRLDAKIQKAVEDALSKADGRKAKGKKKK